MIVPYLYKFSEHYLYRNLIHIRTMTIRFWKILSFWTIQARQIPWLANRFLAGSFSDTDWIINGAIQAVIIRFSACNRLFLLRLENYSLDITIIIQQAPENAFLHKILENSGAKYIVIVQQPIKKLPARKFLGNPALRRVWIVQQKKPTKHSYWYCFVGLHKGSWVHIFNFL